MCSSDLYGDLLGAALGAVVASGAVDGNRVTDDLGRLGDDGPLLIVKGLEVLYIKRTVLLYK